MNIDYGKKLIATVLLILIILFNTKLTISAYSEITFSNITIEDGISQATVETIMQDSKGYIWIGTNDGLDRYNGYNYKVYRKESESKSGLVSNYIVDIKEDNKGNIWVGTTNGISKIDKDGKVRGNYFSDEDNGNLSHPNVNEILIMDDGTVYAGTSAGINVYDEKENKFKRILEGEEDLTNQLIYSLDKDSYGNLWVGTKNGLNKVDLKNNKVERFLSDDPKKNICESHIYKVFCDKDDFVWIGTINSGASRINTKTGEIVNYINDVTKKDSLPNNFVRNFFRDSKDNLWICTSNGLAKYSEKYDNFISYNNKIYDNNSLVDNNTFSIIEDKSGLIWVGTYSGISKFDPSNKIRHYKNDPFNKNSLNDNMIQGIYEDDEEKLWVGTKSGGVNVIDNYFGSYSNLTLSNSSISSNSINDITGHGNYVYFATNNGLNIYNKGNKEIKLISEKDGLSSSNIKNLLYDDKGFLWIGTVDGFDVLDISNNKVINITPYLDKISKDDKYSSAIFKDSEGIYWLGTFVNGGLYKIDAKNNTIVNYTNDKGEGTISDNSIRSISEDSEGHIWVGTSLGLNKFDKNTNTFTTYTINDGLPNNTIYGILFDKMDNPWVSTNLGISKYEKSTNKFINLNVTDGLQSNEFNGEAYCKRKNESFIFGGINGLNEFFPEDLVKSDNNFKVVFDEFKVNGIEVDNIDGEQFSNNKNNIYINVFLPDYTNSKSTQYYYKLDGTYRDWSLMDTNEISFSNLSPGNYTFRVKARNSSGIMSDESKITFTVKPSFWASKYAIFLYLTIIVSIFYYEKNKVKKLDILISTRTRELSDEMDKNAELLNKVIELERNKNNYFVNLSHELRTPLNVISSTEQLISKLSKSEDGISRDKLSTYMNLCRKNIVRLLKLINDIIDTSKIQHGSYKLDIKENDIVFVVEEASLTLKDLIEEKRITLTIDPDIEEKVIQCDENGIERCIVNLVSNAYKYTEPGGEIRVSINDLISSVVIKVKDTGRGIPAECQNLIFDRFNQVVDKNSEVKGGSGLGLTITKQIIDLHQGEIYVESEIGKGSTFVIILPVNQNN